LLRGASITKFHESVRVNTVKKISVCQHDCPDACSVWLEDDGKGAVRIRGNPDHPITQGFTCAKVKGFLERLKSPDRITTPIVRRNNRWHPIGWEEALNLCAEKLQDNRDDPSSILHLPGNGSIGVMRHATDLFFSKLGASTTHGSVCDSAGIAACISDFGSLDSNDIRDIKNARRIVNWGKDLSRSSIHTASFVRAARKQGAKVLTISPGGDGNLPFSDIVMRLRPGTDRFLAAAVIRLFIERGKIKSDIIDSTVGWHQFRDLILRKSMDELSSTCGVAADEIEALYDFYSKEDSAATLVGWGLQRYRYGGENVRFINALVMISGNIGRSGGGSYYNISSLRNFNTEWSRGPVEEKRRYFPEPLIGKSIVEATNPPVRMIWVNGFNVVNQAPDSLSVVRAFDRVDFTVVVDAFMTDTAEMADIVLPCLLPFEKEDIVGSFMHDYVHYANPLFEPRAEAKDDFSILSELGRKLRPALYLPEREDILRMSLDSPYLGISLDALRERGFIRAERPWIAYEGMRFDHADEKYRFPRELQSEGELPPEFPLRLLSLLRREAIHSQIAPGNQERVPTIWIASDNHLLKDLDRGNDVFLVSPLGRMRVDVRTLPNLHHEVVIYRRGDWMKYGGGINRLVEALLTDMGENSSYYSQSVRLEN
jgi:anaerobic selenocysteine-containing dehydrogenase